MIHTLSFLQQQSTIDDEFNTQLAVFLTISAIALFTALALVGWQFMKTWRAKLPISRDESFRALAQEATAAQTATSEALRDVATELQVLGSRVTELERLLRSVE